MDCRIQTGNLPSGVAMRKDGTRGYANNEANFSVTSMNVDDGVCLTLQLDIDSAEPPAPGSFEHAVLVGKLAFFTALGIPDNDIFDTPIREFVPRNFKGKMSKDAWSSCGSCHPDGLADGVTWIFGTGPRQTIPLDGMFSKQNPADQKLLNWSAVRGSNTDFNANSRATQGGCGFASDDFDPGQCFAKGNSDRRRTSRSTTMVSCRGAVRPSMPRRCGSSPLCGRCTSRRVMRGRWRLVRRSLRPIAQPVMAEPSGRRARSSTATTPPPSLRIWLPWTPASPGSRRRRRCNILANEFFSFTCNDLTIKYLENVGTFDITNPLEIRDNAAASTAFGVNGFNVPSLLSINYHAPYLHRGQAQTLEEVFPLHTAARDGGFPRDHCGQLTAAQQADLLVFLKSIDGTTAHLRSEGDVFRDKVRTAGYLSAANTARRSFGHAVTR